MACRKLLRFNIKFALLSLSFVIFLNVAKPLASNVKLAFGLL